MLPAITAPAFSTSDPINWNASNTSGWKQSLTFSCHL